MKKKRVAMMAVALLAVWVGFQYGKEVALGGVALLLLLLGLLRGFRYAFAHAGMDELHRLSERYGIPGQIERLKARETAGKPVRFVVLGDNRNTKKVPPMMHRQIKTEAPDMVFNTGDLARFGSPREYVKRYVPLLDILDPVPVFSVPGNHDRGARRDFAAYRALHGAERFSFDYGPCRFIGVNNSGRSRVQEEDFAWMEQELAKSPIPFKFVFIHIPPRFFEDGVITTSKRRGFKKLQDEFRAMMTRHGVTEVFMAHIHGYATRMVDGVRYTLTAGAGAPLCKELPDAARAYHYVTLEVSEQGLEREVVYLRDGAWLRGE